ncbi:LysR family transcriptional regulator [Streptomyces sp. NPDC053560]|uniref:LysR family transcriptional regulator n=1 Tax=Streptomyces sp. NPDC053560 TaxID=3365711 RepID=UPI0037D516FA
MTPLMGFTLVQLRYLPVTAECGSMTEASGELHIAQSAVSTAINNLERALQVQLRDRTPWWPGASATPY